MELEASMRLKWKVQSAESRNMTYEHSTQASGVSQTPFICHCSDNIIAQNLHYNTPQALLAGPDAKSLQL